MRPGADDGAVPGQPGILAQRRRDRHPALLVRDLIRGTGEEDAHIVASTLAGHRSVAHRLGASDELVHREDIEAPLLTAGYDQATGQAVSKLCGQNETTLVVEKRGVGTKKHNALPPLVDRCGLLTN